ncbi:MULTISPECIES: hypothetical protein [Butyricimonas]|uniref:hypothetical protein n=1 Tax=Butyricimonas TaxID=574697 RepID=UPI0007FB502B|nr:MULTISPECIES: hypothetical protein [Butyricimonas]
MKKLFIILTIGLILGACTKEEVGVYSLGNDYIYMPYNQSIYGTMTTPDTVYMFYNSSPLTVSSTQKRDTFYFKVLVAGLAKNVDRKIKIEPYSCDISYKEDAVAGVNYVAFDDPEMEKHLVIPANSLESEIPIIVTYDQAIAGQYKSFAVKFKLVESEDFKLLGVNSDLTAGNSARTHAYVQFTQVSW